MTVRDGAKMKNEMMVYEPRGRGQQLQRSLYRQTNRWCPRCFLAIVGTRAYLMCLEARKGYVPPRMKNE